MANVAGYLPWSRSGSTDIWTAGFVTWWGLSRCCKCLRSTAITEQPGEPRDVDRGRTDPACCAENLTAQSSHCRQSDRPGVPYRLERGGQVPEGLTGPSEVGKEISETANTLRGKITRRPRARDAISPSSRLLCWPSWRSWPPGRASCPAKWGTESSLDLAKASAARTEANRGSSAEGDASKNFDALTFSDWFTAYLLGHQSGMGLWHSDDSAHSSEWPSRPGWRPNR